MATKSINLTDAERKAMLGGITPPSVVKKIENLEKPKSARYGKSKGMRGQQWVADKIAKIFNITWLQSDDDSPVAVRPSGQHGCDIILRGEVKKKLPFDIEVKWAESFNFTDTIDQAESNTSDGRDYAIVHNRKKFKEPVVIINWSTFEKWIKTLSQ
jgi:hypothetical protein